jgi:hypothetical protein
MLKYKDLCARILPVVIQMEVKVLNKFIQNLKNKLKRNTKDNTAQNLDYAFSIEEINNLEKQNKEKINNLKSKSSPDKKEKVKKQNLTISILEDKIRKKTKEEKELKDSIEEVKEEVENNITESKEEEENQNTKISYINLTKNQEKIIMESWQKIDTIKLDELILKGKDILAHNYSITYGDDSLAFIYKVRSEYDILIEYLIGFNNEKKGIYDKTIFSNKLDNEWHFLANYIKVLERIREMKK